VREAVDPAGVAQLHEVEPARSARAAGGGAELAAGGAQARAEVIFEFGRERAGANARGVGLGDAPDFVDRRRAHAGADAGRASDRIR